MKSSSGNNRNEILARPRRRLPKRRPKKVKKYWPSRTLFVLPPPHPNLSISRACTMSDPSASSSSEPLTPPLEALYYTQYSIWYPLFRKHAPKSTVIDIASVQPELLSWLESDTFVLPEGSGPSTSFAETSNENSDLNDEDEESDDEDEAEPVKLEALDKAIREVIEKYDGGPVFPKLNWSAPLDAGFMLPGNNLQCLHPEDVYLLLKSSEFVGRDLEQIAQTSLSPFQAQETEPASLDISTSTTTPQSNLQLRPQLVLKKWFTFSRSHEFRCFVRSSQLIAICQRDVTFYDHLQSPHLQSQIRSAIYAFWEDVLARKEGWKIKDYVFDVYLTKDLGRVWLVDVNAWLPRTDPLLFGFEELEEIHRREISCRAQQDDDLREEGKEEVVRVYFGASAQAQEDEGEGESVGWGESDVELRVLSDRRMQSSGGTGATYSSNMVPKDLVEFAKTSNQSNNGADMGVDQIVKRFNEQVDLEDGHQ